MWDLIVSVPEHCLSFYFSQDLLSQKPYWRSYRISFCSKCLDRFEATMCSITLQRMHVSDTGR